MPLVYGKEISSYTTLSFDVGIAHCPGACPHKHYLWEDVLLSQTSQRSAAGIATLANSGVDTILKTAFQELMALCKGNRLEVVMHPIQIMSHYTYLDDFSSLVLQQQFKIACLNVRVHRSIISVKTENKAITLTKHYLASLLLLCPV